MFILKIKPQKEGIKKGWLGKGEGHRNLLFMITVWVKKLKLFLFNNKGI
jgi:hypothetical protein